MNELISVIIPVYKVEKYLDRCVESVVNQTYKNIEIILVDDGSPDNCPQMCDDWAKKDERINVIHKENGGVSSARNTGLDKAKGAYIAFVDSDDYIDINMYETLLNSLVVNNADVAECSIMRESPNGKSEHWRCPGEDGYVCSKEKALIPVVSTLNLVCVHCCNKLFSKSVLQNVRFNEKYKYNEDVLFVFEAYLNSDKIVYVDDALFHFYYNVSSASHNRDYDHRFDELEVADTISQKSPKVLSDYCKRGDVLKSFSKISELLVDDTLTNSDFKYLRRRVLNNFSFIISSSLINKYSKIKAIILLCFPHMFKAIFKKYSAKQKAAIEKSYLE